MTAEFTPKLIFVATDCAATRVLYQALNARFGVAQVILEDRPSRISFLRNRVRRLGYSTVAGQVAFQLLAAPVLKYRSKGRVEEILNSGEMKPGILPAAKVTRVVSMNSPEAVCLLTSFAPAVVVVSGTRILSAQTLAALKGPWLNLHAGITPLFRGVHGGYWALATGRAELCGVTVHLVDPGIDSGQILGQAIIEPGPRDNFMTYPFLQLKSGLPLLVRAVEDALKGKLLPVAGLTSESRLWTHPTLGQYLKNLLKSSLR